jgi:hypothetical protein
MQRNERNRRAIEVANYIRDEGAVPQPWVVKFLQLIDAKFPGLTFQEFVAATHIGVLARQQPRGSA